MLDVPTEEKELLQTADILRKCAHAHKWWAEFSSRSGRGERRTEKYLGNLAHRALLNLHTSFISDSKNCQQWDTWCGYNLGGSTLTDSVEKHWKRH